jgi:acyl-coenzyme A thioesterase PaaI-like protein
MASTSTHGEVWELQPNSKHCYACGLENSRGFALRFYQNQENEVRCRVTLPSEYQGYPGIVHGGVVATIMDEVLGRAGMTGEDYEFMVTANLEIKYRKPVPTDEPLEFRGWVTGIRKGLKFTAGELRLPSGEIAVKAEGVLAEHPMGKLEPDEIEALGWKIYPEEL